MKLVIVSICKDEEPTIGKVLDGIPKKILGITKIEKLVLDDGSIDNTASIAKKHGAYVISDGTQKGLATRFQEVLTYVLKNNFDLLVNIDGDLQFDPREIPKLVEPIINNQADFVASDRFYDSETGRLRRPEGMPAGKYYGNKLGARVVSTLSKQKFNDVTCGFRAYNRKAILSLNINSTYTYTQESFQVLALKKLRIKTVPTSVKYYPGRKSRVVKNIFQFIFGSAVNILRAYRDYAPLRFFGSLGIILFIPGLIMGGFTAVHWVSTGKISPYIAIGAIGLYLITMAFFIWGLGLVADMLDRILNNQEKILQRQKEIQYERPKKEK